MTTDTPVRISIIGAGVIARFHAAAALKLQRPVQLSVTDPNPDAVRAFTAEFPDARVAPDIDALLAPDALPDDIVVIAAPPRFHHAPAVAALNSGRHVLCEKPLALNLEQAREMLAAARANDRLLGCCSMRFADLPANRRVRQLLDEKALGVPYHVSFINRAQRSRPGVEYQPASTWFLDPAFSGGGVIMDWGPYVFACLLNLFQVRRVDILSAWHATPITAADPFENMPTEQHAAAALRLHTPYGPPIPVTYEHAVCTHGEPRRHVEIEGTRAAVRWDWNGDEGKVEIARDVNGKVAVETEAHPFPLDLHPHYRPVLYFYRRVIGEPSPAIVNEQALFPFATLRAIYDTARTNHPHTVELESP